MELAPSGPNLLNERFRERREERVERVERKIEQLGGRLLWDRFRETRLQRFIERSFEKILEK